MNNLILSNTLTMSSRDLLDIINDVRKTEGENSIRANDFHARVADELSDFNYETFVVQNLNKTESTIFKLTQDMCMLVAMRESKKVRRVVLEKLKSQFKQTNSDPMKALNDPSFLRDTLLTYSEKVLTLEHENNTLKPKAEALDRIAKTDGSLCITNAAKDLQIRPKEFINMLHSEGWIYRRNGNGSWTAYQDKIKRGLLEHKLTTVYRSDGTEKISEQVRVTPKGIARLSEMLCVVH